MPEKIPLIGAVPAPTFGAILRAQIEEWEKKQDAVIKPLDEWWTDFVAFCSGQQSETEVPNEEAE